MWSACSDLAKHHHLWLLHHNSIWTLNKYVRILTAFEVVPDQVCDRPDEVGFFSEVIVGSHILIMMGKVDGARVFMIYFPPYK